MLQGFLQSGGFKYFFVCPFLFLFQALLSLGLAGVGVGTADEGTGDL
jgi:hypothetical protein